MPSSLSKIFALAVDPAAREAHGVRREHEVLEHAGAVLHEGAASAVGEHHHDGRRAVVRVGFLAHDGGVERAQALAGLGARHGHDHRRLVPAARGRVGARLKHGVEQLLGDGVRLVAAHAPARLDEVDEIARRYAALSLAGNRDIEKPPICPRTGERRKDDGGIRKNPLGFSVPIMSDLCVVSSGQAEVLLADFWPFCARGRGGIQCGEATSKGFPMKDVKEACKVALVQAEPVMFDKKPPARTRRCGSSTRRRAQAPGPHSLPRALHPRLSQSG